VVFPAESHAEKDGTVVHPDGRLQRLRTAIAHPGEVRAGWWVLDEIARRVGYETRVTTGPTAFAELVAAVPFYKGLTLEQISGRGVRWPVREEAAALPAGAEPTAAKPSRPKAPSRKPARGTPADGALRLGTYRPIWAAPEVEISPALRFAVARQQIELSPDDAARLGIADGETVTVSHNETRLRATAAVRSGVPAGVAFAAEGIATDSANALTEPLVEVRKS
jgi:NADH-quinone oxidoreductase subunit G